MGDRVEGVGLCEIITHLAFALTPSHAVERLRRRATAGNGLKNLALLDSVAFSLTQSTPSARTLHKVRVFYSIRRGGHNRR